MPLITLEQAGRQFRTEPIWENVNLSIEPGSRLGIIGANGSGKSSLLRVLAGLDAPDSGTYTKKNHLRISFLEQNPSFPPELTVKEALTYSLKDTVALLKEYEAACRELSLNNSPENNHLVNQLTSELEARGAWEIESRISTMMGRLHLINLEGKIGDLSVGQRKRAAIAAALIADPEVLLLDEPTNHLDALTVDWLESQLRAFKGSVVTVTHDRYFLDKITSSIAEISHGQVTLYEGSYAEYLVKKEHEAELEARGEEKRANLIRREMDWFKRGARARSTKQKARQERLMELLDNKPNNEASDVSLQSLSGCARLGNKGVILHNISKSFGKVQLFDNYSLELNRGSRIGFVGANGSGKTTLLNIITEQILPDSGYVEVGTTVVPGTYHQEFINSLTETDLSMSALDYVREAGEYIVTPNGRQVSAEVLMENFLFPRPSQRTPLAKLSGGERKRLGLLRLLMTSPNLLLLDEPTNDLDIPTLIKLEAWLDDYPGILIVVSHDRYFLDRTVDRLFYFDEGNPHEFKGDFETLREYLKERLKQQEPAPASKRLEREPSSQPKRSAKLSFKEKRELENIESELEKGDQRRHELETILTAPSSNAQLIGEAYSELEALKARQDELLNRWEELSSKIQ